MVNYKKGKIYVIRCRSNNKLIYVGSSTQTLSQRMAGHRCDCNKGRYSRCSLYNYIIDNNWDDWYIELYELFPCNSREELDKKEGEVIREIGTINKRIAGRSLKDYQKENYDKIKERNLNYKKDNYEKLREKKKEYYKKNANKIKEKYINNKK